MVVASTALRLDLDPYLSPVVPKISTSTVTARKAKEDVSGEPRQPIQICAPKDVLLKRYRLPDLDKVSSPWREGSSSFDFQRNSSRKVLHSLEYPNDIDSDRSKGLPAFPRRSSTQVSPFHWQGWRKSPARKPSPAKQSSSQQDGAKSSSKSPVSRPAPAISDIQNQTSMSKSVMVPKETPMTIEQIKNTKQSRILSKEGNSTVKRNDL